MLIFSYSVFQVYFILSGPKKHITIPYVNGCTPFSSHLMCILSLSVTAPTMLLQIFHLPGGLFPALCRSHGPSLFTVIVLKHNVSPERCIKQVLAMQISMISDHKMRCCF